jgi:ATP-dependent RNA circularization protein (DNA/RNA ligase family)
MLFVFDIYDIDAGKYFGHDERVELFAQIKSIAPEIQHVPFFGRMKLPSNDVQDLLTLADGPSLTHPIREGLVWKRIDGKFSFKTISNKFLLSGGS